MHQEVTNYLSGLSIWKAELTRLRDIISECGLKEEYKWMRPCYTYNGKNIVLIHEFKRYCAMSFFKGALLADNCNILIQPTENTQSGRQIRFTDLPEIEQLESTIKEYIKEAIEVEKSGLHVTKKATSDFEVPDELVNKFRENPDFEKAFKKLTGGRQRGYLLYFNKPKQSKTKMSRIKMNMKRIMDGYGLNDCVCGLSKRKPNCDGSHKQLEKS